MNSSGLLAKGTDLFNFQGIRRRIFLVETSTRDENFFDDSTSRSEPVFIENFENVEENFERAVRPSIDENLWRKQRENQREEIDRLGDLTEFYRKKPKLNEFEQRVYKRSIRRDRSVQTEPEKSSRSTRKQTKNLVPKLRLPTPAAMEKIEIFLAENRWRLIDLFRRLDLDKSWTIAKEDLSRFVQKEGLNVNEAQIEELISCFCREAEVPMDYRKFSRGRSACRKSFRESRSKTPNSSDQRTVSGRSSPISSNKFLKLPPIDISNNYPTRDVFSSLSRSTISSSAKIKTLAEFN